MGEGPNVVIRVSQEGAEEAGSQVQQVGANWDQVGLQGARAARSLTNGLSGLLSAQQNVYQAQLRVNTANINYILTVREYGAGSIQAQRALDSLKSAQMSVTVAQDQLNLRWVQFALTTGPQVYTAISRMIAASMGMTLQNYQETASWYAKAAAIGATAVALALVSFGFSALMGGAAAAATTQVTQTNTFYQTPGTSTSNLVNLTNQGIASAVSASSRP